MGGGGEGVRGEKGEDRKKEKKKEKNLLSPPKWGIDRFFLREMVLLGNEGSLKIIKPRGREGNEGKKEESEKKVEKGREREKKKKKTHLKRSFIQTSIK